MLFYGTTLLFHLCLIGIILGLGIYPMKSQNPDNSRNQTGFSLPELVVVLLVAAIILVLALPQIISSRRLFRFAGVQRQVATALRETRQEAMSQRRPVTFRYDNGTKMLVAFGGDFGALGDVKNRFTRLADAGLEDADIVYGKPPGAPAAALGDTTNLTALTASAVEITFQPDGSVLDGSGNPQNKALFFYHDKYRNETAFAVSVLGAGGRIKTWRFSEGANAYIE
jgi:prepilin-type N-terminal cleavage/methylation domain-containing protein